MIKVKFPNSNVGSTPRLQWRLLFFTVLFLSLLSHRHTPFCEHNQKTTYPVRARYFGVPQPGDVTEDGLPDSVLQPLPTTRQ